MSFKGPLFDSLPILNIYIKETGGIVQVQYKL